MFTWYSNGRIVPMSYRTALCKYIVSRLTATAARLALQQPATTGRQRERSSGAALYYTILIVADIKVTLRPVAVAPAAAPILVRPRVRRGRGRHTKEKG
ncbi:hypothetical protein J6590_039201 [Homalodisca vitripennis]|nr:hypothetical protein J6590_039201 [Homalodisca vitripennis]